MGAPSSAGAGARSGSGRSIAWLIREDARAENRRDQATPQPTFGGAEWKAALPDACDFAVPVRDVHEGDGKCRPRLHTTRHSGVPLPIAAARPRTRGTSLGHGGVCRQRGSDKVHGNKESRRAAVAPRPSAAVSSRIRAGMAELADAADLKFAGRKAVGV